MVIVSVHTDTQDTICSTVSNHLQEILIVVSLKTVSLKTGYGKSPPPPDLTPISLLLQLDYYSGQGVNNLIS